MSNQKKWLSAPLPFQGQKRNWRAEFSNALKQFDDCTIFVDIFGGSGLLSRIVADQRPDAHVVYNDFDDYSSRIRNINNTNTLLSDIRLLLINCPREKRLPETVKSAVLDRIKQEEAKGFVDYITISPNLLFSMNYITCYSELLHQPLYNNVRKSDYQNADCYLEGLEVVRKDYKKLFAEYKDQSNVCFLLDPPYLSTDCSTYSTYWRLSAHLDILKTLDNSNFFYFTSNKSEIIDLCQWLETNVLYNPFNGATRLEKMSPVSYGCSYIDIMLYKRCN